MDENIKRLPHSLIVEERKKIIISGIVQVGNFDEDSITVFTSADEITLKGEKLQVTEVNTDSGQFCAEGKIVSVTYSEKKKNTGRIFTGLFR